MGALRPIYYDAEFTGLHRNTTLISIGMISRCGSYFYAEFNDYDQSQVDDWLQKHVIDNLFFNDEGSSYLSKSNPYTVHNETFNHWNVMMKDSSKNIKNELLSWLHNEAHSTDSNQSDEQIQFYTDCYAYDWMLLNDLICDGGFALNLPKYINYIPYDLSTLLQSSGIDPDINREEFIGNQTIEYISHNAPFIRDSSGIKHNCLWDAAVAKACFDKIKITKETANNV